MLETSRIYKLQSKFVSFPCNFYRLNKLACGGYPSFVNDQFSINWFYAIHGLFRINLLILIIRLSYVHVFLRFNLILNFPVILAKFTVLKIII
jgi:hypothetical protein